MNDDRNGEVALSMVLGFALGAVIGLLVAPSAGRETRRKLADTSKRLRGEAEGKFREARQFVNTQGDQLRSAVVEGKRAYRQARTDDAPKPRRKPQLEEPRVGV